MDPATIIGILLAFGSLYAMIFLEGAHVQSVLLPAPMILVFGATIAIGLASFTMRDTISSFKAVGPAIKGSKINLDETVQELVGYAETARSEGLLSLEQKANEAKDPFLKKALQNIADGTDGDDLRTMMEDEIATKNKTGRGNSKFFAALGGYAPTVGIVGTVVSLTHVLENLNKPDELGHMIAAAFVATLWGLLSSNFIWLPISSRIGRLNELEVDKMNLQLEGIMAIQEGAQPMLLTERLTALVPPGKAAKASKEKTEKKAA
ncbi:MULTISPECIES: motility protein A [unclassified Arthrobacter]|uniref:motility protein A n=1 Tax=unclassified Arthrobacter TaxID=235627 RepID=UPI001490DE8B|nr:MULTISPECIES: MotA/TolQ/ExbB proton channel family protein [unclassified Arthrobacter]MBE0010813.1 motility protein A [Arthrobacter sp. AET 35A]NOJ64620.1 motility protein A [Arthrobacter sp. 147(2020)]